jgi:hypothetical protein
MADGEDVAEEGVSEVGRLEEEANEVDHLEDAVEAEEEQL